MAMQRKLNTTSTTKTYKTYEAAQKAFEANSKSITTSDEFLQTAMNMIK